MQKKKRCYFCDLSDVRVRLFRFNIEGITVTSPTYICLTCGRFCMDGNQENVLRERHRYLEFYSNNAVPKRKAIEILSSRNKQLFLKRE